MRQCPMQSCWPPTLLPSRFKSIPPETVPPILSFLKSSVPIVLISFQWHGVAHCPTPMCLVDLVSNPDTRVKMWFFMHIIIKNNQVTFYGPKLSFRFNKKSVIWCSTDRHVARSRSFVRLVMCTINHRWALHRLSLSLCRMSRVYAWDGQKRAWNVWPVWTVREFYW